MGTLTPIAKKKTKAFRAVRYVAKVIDELYPHLRGASFDEIYDRFQPARHSPDFRSVRWHGRDYTFTPTQAVVVRILWQAFLNGTPRVGAAAILEGADMVSDSVADLFKGHPAWGEMVFSDKRGAYWLEPREDSPAKSA